MAEELPDLDPTLLLSDSARREVEAMGGLERGSTIEGWHFGIDPGERSVGVVVSMSRTASESEVSFVEPAIGFGNEEISFEDPPYATVEDGGGPAESLFMTGEALAALQAGVLASEAPVGRPGGASGRVSPRFRIDRESPPPAAPRLDYSGFQASGQDGSVVRQLSSQGRWEAVQAARPAPSRPQAPRPVTSTPPAPARSLDYYDLLMGD